MAAAIVYLVRHGETTENRAGIMQGQRDTELNAAGLEQAQLAANALENVRFAAAHSSDLSRAVKVSECSDCTASMLSSRRKVNAH